MSLSGKAELPLSNDNSNPQQGYNWSTSSVFGVKLASKTNTRTADDKAIQEETRKQIRHLKIPPTKKDGRKLFVGGVGSNVTDNDFREYFEEYGTVIDSVVMFDKQSHRSRGFGFVAFEDEEVARALLGKASKEPHTITIKGKVCEIKPAVPKSDSFSRRTSCVAGHVTSALGRTSSSFTFQQGAKLRDPWTQENFMLDLPLQNPSEQWDATSNTYAVGISYESHDSNLSGNPAKMYHEPHELPSPIFGVNGIMYYPSCFPFEPLVDDSFSRWSVAPGDEFRCIDGPNPVNAKRSSMHPAWSSELASPVFVGGMPYSYPTMSDFPDPISLPCFHSWPDNVPTSANMVAFQGNAQEEEEE